MILKGERKQLAALEEGANFCSVAAAIVGSAAVGAMVSSSAAGEAADAQTQAAAQSDATQRYMYDQTRADQAPWMEAGRNALGDLVAGLGPDGRYSKKFTAADMAADPVYNSGLEFGLSEGRKGLERQAAAGGNLLSGATLKALTKYGNDYASTKANDSFNRFQTEVNGDFNRRAGIAGVGQTATSQVGAAGQTMANNISQSQMAVGNVRGASAIGQANALTGSINNGMNFYQGSQQLDALQQRNKLWESAMRGGSTGINGGYWNDPGFQTWQFGSEGE